MEIRKPRIGVVCMARTTFDIPFAEETVNLAWNNLQNLEIELIGTRTLLCDKEAVEDAVALFRQDTPDALLILQVTFTDAAMTVELLKQTKLPVLIWSFPEPRDGDRLRLNALCGSNLASHALGKAGIKFDYLHQKPESKEAAVKVISFARSAMAVRLLSQSRLLVIGDHPDGFDTCEFDAPLLKEWCGLEVEKQDILPFLEKVSSVPDSDIEDIHARVDGQVSNLKELEPESLKKSFKVYKSLRDEALEGNFDALAVRCWPEFFTELGCAACGPMSMMTEDKTPCACEADLYGVLTSLVLQYTSGTSVFLADLVDINPDDNTGVFWHCGLAPLSMADPVVEVRATIHTNRKMPFLYEFTLKPSTITFMRISQAENRQRLIFGKGEVIRAPMSYTGTSGVVRFEKPAGEVFSAIMEKKLEHHYSIVYGDYESELRTIGRLLDIPVEKIT